MLKIDLTIANMIKICTYICRCIHA